MKIEQFTLGLVDGWPSELRRGGGSVVVNADGSISIVGDTDITGTLDVSDAVALASTLAFTNTAEGNTGAVTKRTTRQVVPMGAGATAVSTSISVPSGARLIAVALNVDVEIANAGDDTWAAAFSGGSTTAIAAAGQAKTQNTKITLMLVDEITTGVTEVTFTPQSANFSAGSIEVVVWYEEATALADA